MIRRILAIMLLCCFLLSSGCGFFSTAGPKDKVKVYTTLDKTFVETLCNNYSEGLPADKKVLFEVMDQEDELVKADCIISEAAFLKKKNDALVLQNIHAEFADLLPKELRGEEDSWITLFYDPAVLLINQAYSRKVGQQQLLHWYDLPKQSGAQVVMENLSDNESTKLFLATMASHMGQNECLTYFKQIRPMIRQYAKFPITPVRMAATGDADIAVTRRSHAFKYLQNDFPAYILIPEEGAPVNLYGIGLLKNSKNQKNITDFINWMLQSAEVRTTLMTTRSGFLPVLPQGDKGQAIRMNQLWTNTFYKDAGAVDKLADDWLKEIRLAGTREETK